MLCVTMSVVRRMRAHHVVRDDHDLLGRPRIERGGVLVEQQEVGSRDRRHEQRHRLPLAAGQRAHRRLQTALEPHA